MNILGSVKKVADQSKHVFIDTDAILEFAGKYENKDSKYWLSEGPFDVSKLSDKDKLQFLFLFDQLGFSYWGDPKWAVKYKGATYDGSWAMTVCIGRAFEAGVPILDCKYQAGISREEFAELLNGNIEIPLLAERWKILRETSAILNEKYDGLVWNLVQTVKGDATALVEKIVSEFPSFVDSSIYRGNVVEFHKLAQLFTADVHQAFGGTGIGEMKNIDKLTACADYKLPQILRRIGVLSYSEDLAERIDNMVMIAKDSEEEIEIRANTVMAVEMLKDAIQETCPEVNSIHINDFIWLLGQTKSDEDKPYHRTRTCKY
jgi:hypothetical protein